MCNLNDRETSEVWRTSEVSPASRAGRARQFFCLWLLLLAAGCGTTDDQDEGGPLQLGDRWIIQDGEPAFLTEEDETDLMRTHFNEQKAIDGRISSFDYDYSSKKSGEHYRGKISGIRRDGAGKVVYFDVSINGLTGHVRAEP